MTSKFLMTMEINMYCMLALSSLQFDQTTCNSFIITKYDKRCPYPSEWKIKAATKCEQLPYYYCLWDDYQKEYTELCRDKPNLWSLGTKCVLRGNLDSEECFPERFQPFVFSTEGTSDCIFTKSLCEDEGLVVYHDGSTSDNRKCRCDFDLGYSLVLTTHHYSFCNPFEEDCSCFRKTPVESSNFFEEFNCTKDTFGCSRTKRLPHSMKNNSQIETTNRIERNILSNVYGIVVCILLVLSIIMASGYIAVIIYITDETDVKECSNKIIYNEMSSETTRQVFLLENDAADVKKSKPFFATEVFLMENDAANLKTLKRFFGKEVFLQEYDAADMKKSKPFPATKVFLMENDAADMKMLKQYLGGEIRIVLVGKTGVGKSSTANTLLGSNCFQANDDPIPVTKKCTMIRGTVNHKQFLIIDTPGILGLNENEKETELEIKRCIFLATPGPHAFLLIIEYGRFRKEDIESIETFLKYFGEKLKKFVIIVFTHADKLPEDQITDQWLRKLPDLNNFINECERRYCLIDNTANARNKEQYVTCLINAIEALQLKNGLLHYISITQQ